MNIIRTIQQTYISFTCFVSRFESRKKRRHKYKQDQAAKVINTLSQFTGNKESLFPRKLAYLRKIDANVFEELVLDAFVKQGFLAERNLRYTGDGGIDVRKHGRVFDKEKHQWCGIQCKRYKGFIQVSHVKDFANDLLTAGLSSGYFVHTGAFARKTPKSICGLLPDNIKLISGSSLIDLITEHSH
jgi:restriction system protein